MTDEPAAAGGGRTAERDEAFRAYCETNEWEPGMHERDGVLFRAAFDAGEQRGRASRDGEVAMLQTLTQKLEKRLAGYYKAQMDNRDLPAEARELRELLRRAGLYIEQHVYTGYDHCGAILREIRAALGRGGS